MSRPVYVPREPRYGEFNPATPVQELSPYTGELQPLTDADLKFFKDVYEVVPLPGQIMVGGWPYNFGRYALPIYSPNGATRGHVLRAPWPGSPLYTRLQLPKAVTYVQERGPVLSHYHPVIHNRALVVVEDQLSAIKLAQAGLRSIALLGTPRNGEIGMDRLTEISQSARGGLQTLIALDADATEEAFLFARKWGHAFNHLRVAPLTQDIKDTPMAEIFKVLGLGA